VQEISNYTGDPSSGQTDESHETRKRRRLTEKKPRTQDITLVNSHDPITNEMKCQKKPEDPIKIEEKPKRGRKNELWLKIPMI
jgi:hypothetical protein